MEVGILSDTHGRLRDEVVARLAGVDLLLHAGDVGDPDILERLRSLAPLIAVRGNVDAVEPLSGLAAKHRGTLGDGVDFAMVHQRDDIAREWTRECRLIVYGHSHRPELEWRGRCLLLNPGACGPRRFTLPLTVARLRIEGERLIPELLSVEPASEPEVR